MADADAKAGDDESRRKNVRNTFLTAIKNDDDEAIAKKLAALQKERAHFDDEDPDKGFISDIMMSLDTHNVSALRKEFEKRGDEGLTLTEFVHVMKHCLVSADGANGILKGVDETQLVCNLCELFAQIDINGDGTMEWDEFTSFIVEMGMASHDHQPDAIQKYNYKCCKEVGNRRTSYIAQVYYFDPDAGGNDTVVTCDVDSTEFRVFSSSLELRCTVQRADGVIGCVDYMGTTNQYVVASSDLALSFYDEFTGVLAKSFRTLDSQMCMTWIPEYQTLYTADTSGVIHAWDVEDMEEKYHMGAGSRHASRHDRESAEFSHSDIVLSLLQLAGLEMLASASMDCTIGLWDLQTGKHKRTLEGHTKGVRCLSYSPEYRLLVSGGFDFDVIVWNPYVAQTHTKPVPRSSPSSPSKNEAEALARARARTLSGTSSTSSCGSRATPTRSAASRSSPTRRSSSRPTLRAISRCGTCATSRACRPSRPRTAGRAGSRPSCRSRRTSRSSASGARCTSSSTRSSRTPT